MAREEHRITGENVTDYCNSHGGRSRQCLTKIFPHAERIAVPQLNGAVEIRRPSVRGTILVVVLQVECYSGAKADERPVRFRLDDRVFFIEEVLDQWYGPDDTFFKVRADDGNLYILRRDQSIPEGTWSLTSFRRLEREEKSP